MKTLLLIAIFSLTDVCFAAAGDIDDFFVSFLKGEQTVFESNKKVSRREIQRMRVEIWTAWREAVNENEEFKLAKMDKDTVVSASKWKLPPELENNAVMNFTLFNKGKKPLTGYPLFLYLHGSGPKEKEYARGLELTKGFNDAPSVYFVPQIPNEGGYYRWWQRAKIYAWERLLRLAMVSGDYNPDKIYIVGISEGAYGTQRLTSYFADYLAGGGAMAGGEPLKNAPAVNCANTAFSLITGSYDAGFYRNTLTGYTAEAFDELAQGKDSMYMHRIELIPGKGHSIDYSTTTPWLSQFTRDPYPKYVSWENFPVDGCYRKGFHNLYVNEPSHVTKDGRTYYEEKIVGDTIILNVDTVAYETIQKDSIWGIDMKFKRNLAPAQHGNVTIFLNRSLVNLSRPVTVILNGNVVHHGKVPESLASMVNSCAYYGDPRRIYTAQVDVKW